MIGIEMRGLEEAEKALGISLKPAIKRATYQIAQEVKDELDNRPGPPQYPIAWVNEKQRKKVMGLIKEHQAKAGLIAAWRAKHSGAINAVVENPLWWSPFVQAEGAQQPFHAQTGWVTDVEALGAVVDGGKADRILETEINRWVNEVDG